MVFVAAFQLFDAVVASCNGVLRGVGRQKIIGPLQLGAYYLIGMPISLSTTFKLKWGLPGLWTGIICAQFFLFITELIYIWRIDFKECVDKAVEEEQ